MNGINNERPKLELVLVLEEPTSIEKVENLYAHYIDTYQPENQHSQNWLPATYDISFKSKKQTPENKCDIVKIKVSKSLTLQQIKDLIGYFESKEIWAKSVGISTTR